MGLGAAVLLLCYELAWTDVASVVPLVADACVGWVCVHPVSAFWVIRLVLYVASICAVRTETAIRVAVADQDLDVLPVCIFPVTHIELEHMETYVAFAKVSKLCILLAGGI